jgi:hypothetical protein
LFSFEYFVSKSLLGDLWQQKGSALWGFRVELYSGPFTYCAKAAKIPPAKFATRNIHMDDHQSGWP